MILLYFRWFLLHKKSWSHKFCCQTYLKSTLKNGYPIATEPLLVGVACPVSTLFHAHFPPKEGALWYWKGEGEGGGAKREGVAPLLLESQLNWCLRVKGFKRSRLSVGGVATLFSASFGGYILMLVKDSSSHLSLYEELRNLQADTVRELKDLTLQRAYGVKLP